MNAELRPFLGERYQTGFNDCYTLVQRYFSARFGLELTNYARPTNWYMLKELDFFNKFFAKEGFEDTGCSSNHVRKGDVLLINLLKSPCDNHVAVYVGNNKILHHLQGQRSQVEEYSYKWRLRVSKVLRHPIVLMGIESKTITTLESQLPPMVRMRIKNER